MSCIWFRTAGTLSSSSRAEADRGDALSVTSEGGLGPKCGELGVEQEEVELLGGEVFVNQLGGEACDLFLQFHTLVNAEGLPGLGFLILLDEPTFRPDDEVGGVHRLDLVLQEGCQPLTQVCHRVSLGRLARGGEALIHLGDQLDARRKQSLAERLAASALL